MPGLPLQPPGDTPRTLRLGALAAAAAAALAAAARAASPALLAALALGLGEERRRRRAAAPRGPSRRGFLSARLVDGLAPSLLRGRATSSAGPGPDFPEGRGAGGRAGGRSRGSRLPLGPSGEPRDCPAPAALLPHPSAARPPPPPAPLLCALPGGSGPSAGAREPGPPAAASPEGPGARD